MGASKRRGVEPTHDWQFLLPLFGWPEQERYEEIRPLVLLDASVAERARDVGTEWQRNGEFLRYPQARRICASVKDYAAGVASGSKRK